MALFPALRPAQRRYGFGLFPVTVESGFGGGSVRFLHGSVRYGVNLELGYTFINETEMQQLRDHYRGQDGGTESFLLPDVIWSGHSSVANIVPAGTSWIYASQPEEEDLNGLLFNASVQLLQVI